MRTNLGTTQRAALTLGSAAIALLGLAAPAHAAGQAHEHQDHRSTSLKEGRGHNDKWQAQADPDGDENGGVDQPGGTGGVDKTDQDGNNGSGNDSDCEDDNRGKGVPGHCKDKDKGDDTASSRPGDQTPGTEDSGSSDGSDSSGSDAGETPSTTGGTTGGQGGAGSVGTPGTTGTTVTTSTTSTGTGATTPTVLGVEQSAAGSTDAETGTAAAGRAPSAVSPVDKVAAVLPNTGSDAAMLALFAGGLGSVAAGTVLLRRRRAEAL